MPFASSSLVMESWARKASGSRARPAPLTSCATGKQNSPSMKVTGGEGELTAGVNAGASGGAARSLLAVHIAVIPEQQLAMHNIPALS